MDMAVEFMVFLGIGIILVGILSVFMFGWDFTDDADILQDMYEDEKKFEYRETKIEFTNSAKDFWDFCNHSYANKTKSFYVYESESEPKGVLSKKNMFDQYKQLSFCGSIQSRNLSCGNREDVNMTNITLPAVVNLRCTNRTLYIK